MRELIDSFNRRIDYLRLSVTDRCDLRCTYCIPKGFKNFQEPASWLRFDEIERVVGAFTELGVRRVRLTGGEPLLRRDLAKLAARLTALNGLEDLSLSTNATQLDKHARSLYDAGVARLNVSLDSLRADRFAAITNGGKLEKVLSGLAAAKAAGFTPIKINMVVMGGVNDDEIDDLIAYCGGNGFSLRLIETMPMGDTGRSASGQYVDLQDVRRRLEQRYELVPAAMPGGGPARYVKVQATGLTIGFITPISQHFCATCNRVRVSVDGTLYLCLGQEEKLELRPLLRAGINDAELRAAILQAIALKPERHEFKEAPAKLVRFMSLTGG